MRRVNLGNLTGFWRSGRYPGGETEVLLSIPQLSTFRSTRNAMDGKLYHLNLLVCPSIRATCGKQVALIFCGHFSFGKVEGHFFF